MNKMDQNGIGKVKINQWISRTLSGGSWLGQIVWSQPCRRTSDFDCDIFLQNSVSIDTPRWVFYC